MNRFWDKIIKPIILREDVKAIVEIGAEAGVNTVKLLEYCKGMDAKLYVVDPAPRFDTYAFQAVFGEQLELKQSLSLEALPDIDHYDVVLIDGDHNWYTVYHELKEIENKATQTGKFPIVFLHDTEWPYGRRDLYYIPESIPAEYRKPYARKGMQPGQSELLEVGGVNATLNNALFEHGEKNGVLTAVEDFLKETSLSLSFHQVYTGHGLGIILPSDPKRDKVIQYILDTSGF